MSMEKAAEAFDDPQWAFEILYDGCRCLAEWSADGARLQDGRGTDMSSWFAEVAGVLAFLGGRRCIVDGAICVLNDQHVAGRAESRRLLQRKERHGFKPGDDPVVYCVFDALVIGGKNVMHLPLLERKKLLRPLLQGAPHVLVVRDVVGEGLSMYGLALSLELEGIVAKRLESAYQPGVRSPDWRRIARPPIHR
ncbi:hypothetical protein [Piscinibacter sp. XHJ-5]|uniref:ATP-dependent DNA ligase n=1 Tax=Piscinibacter sp. XHJ-5 TaxID=3037797 RepID=UPI0024532B9B|nr:hypothetical protein [Piscinibacter sp. XHJ-5]